MVLIATERSSWYSSSLSVCVGATTMDSPVWMPIGSRFSMLQTVMQLSRPSRTTSYSISFQPRRHSSTSTWGTPPSKARRSAWSRSASVSTMPLPWPPRAKPPRSMTGKPISRAAARASSARAAGAAARGAYADLGQPLDEELAVLGVADGLHRRAEHPHAVLVEDARLVEREPAVERGLAAEGKQDARPPPP